MFLAFVVDSNIFFTFFWGQSTTRRLFLETDVKLFSPFYALEEIKKYASEIQKKAKISKREFKEIYQVLIKRVRFFPLEFYQESIKEVRDIPDINDIDFITLALKLRIPLWSNDYALKEQHFVRVLNTKEVITLLD
jgi:predicted nucleic acid-binding protein